MGGIGSSSWFPGNENVGLPESYLALRAAVPTGVQLTAWLWWLWGILTGQCLRGESSFTSILKAVLGTPVLKPPRREVVAIHAWVLGPLEDIRRDLPP